MSVSRECPGRWPELTNHSCQLFASVVVEDDKEALPAFVCGVRGHDGESLRESRGFDLMKDTLQAFAIRAADSSLCLLLVGNPLEFVRDSPVEDIEALNQPISSGR